MTAFATADELAEFVGRTFTDAEESRAELLLDLATALVQNVTGQTISAVAGDSLEMRGSWTNELWLPQRPVTAITSITVDGLTLAVSTYEFDQFGRVTADQLGWGIVGNGPTDDVPYFGGDNVLVTVVYSHGYATIPASIKLVTLAAAARALVNPDGVTQESIGSYSVTYARTAGTLVLTKDEATILKRFRRRTYLA